MMVSAVEERIRESLADRAGDVEATPALWARVDARLARRRRLRLTALGLAGAAAIGVAALVAPGLLGSDGAPVPTIDPVEPAGPGEDEADVEGGTPSDGVVPAPEGPGIEPTLPATPVVRAEGRSLVLEGADGGRTLVTLPAEGESRFVTAAVRPGSTEQDLVVVSHTEAEGLPDLRWTQVVDGEVVVAWEPFPAHLGPTPGTVPPHVAGPVWSPEGDTVGWTEQRDDELALRLVGWSDEGPGTGERATDNAAFDLTDSVGGPASVSADWSPTAWEPAAAGGPTATVLRLADLGGEHDEARVALDRQPDGAWARPAG